MLALLGMTLVLSGCFGVGLSLCEKEEQRIRVLEQWIISLGILCNEIKRKGQPLPFAVEECKFHTVGEVFEFYNEVIKKREEKNLLEVWKEELELYLKKTILNKEGRKRIHSLEGILGYEEEKLQIKMLQMGIENIHNYKTDMEEGKREKQKMMMLLSFAGGIVMVLLLV